MVYSGFFKILFPPTASTASSLMLSLGSEKRSAGCGDASGSIIVSSMPSSNSCGTPGAPSSSTCCSLGDSEGLHLAHWLDPAPLLVPITSRHQLRNPLQLLETSKPLQQPEHSLKTLLAYPGQLPNQLPDHVQAMWGSPTLTMKHYSPHISPMAESSG